MSESEGHPFGEVELANGLTVTFRDLSRPVAGDRWQVKLVAVIPIKIVPEHFCACSNQAEAYETALKAFGEAVSFRREIVRNFISEPDRQAMLEKMKSDFLQSVLAYISSPNFAPNFIMKRFGAYMEEESVRRAHAAAINREENG